MAVGQRVNTIYGVGIITDMCGTFGRGVDTGLDPILATIMVPGNPPVVFTQAMQTLVFTEGMNGQISTKDGLSQ
jgi:hypothetical protein